MIFIIPSIIQSLRDGKKEKEEKEEKDEA